MKPNLINSENRQGIFKEIFYVGFKSFRNLFKRGIEFIKVKGNYIE